MRILPLLAAWLGLLGCASRPVSAPVNPNLADALAPVFQADMPAAMARLAVLPVVELDPSQRRTRDCVLARFGSLANSTTEPGDVTLLAPASDVLRTYRRYWTTALMRQATAQQAEAALSNELGKLLGGGETDINGRSEAAVRMIESHGVHALGGVTPPLYELMIWREQATHRETIALPGGAFDVQVTMLAGFASLGWAAWATCDRSHTGGWTTSDGIMVVAAAWQLDGEEYRVSLLAHEAQHFSDRTRYPQLAAADLEYRAKLTELILARETQRALLEKFATEAKRDRALPHSFASYWLIERLRARLGSDHWAAISGDWIREAAAAEFAAHTVAIDARGRESVRSALPD